MATHGIYQPHDNLRRKRSQLQGVDCYDRSNRGIHYRGVVNITKWGINCKPWMEYQLRNAKQHSNYCRNPTGKLDGPWCYIDETDHNWQYCDIPPCQNLNTKMKKSKEEDGSCSYYNGGCSHTCIDQLEGDHQCKCPEGLILAQDELNCVDPSLRLHGNCHRNNGGCSHHCIQDRGNHYYCTCPSGYQLLINGQSCKFKWNSISSPNHLDKRDDCRYHNGGCSHICIQMANQRRYCRCRKGFKLDVDGQNCLATRSIHSSPKNQYRGCQHQNGGCQHLCIELGQSHVCSCRDGYKLNTDGKSCKGNKDTFNSGEPLAVQSSSPSDYPNSLVGGCQHQNGGCQHLCIEFGQSPVCSCRDGYRLDIDGKSCKAEKDTSYAGKPLVVLPSSSSDYSTDFIHGLQHHGRCSYSNNSCQHVCIDAGLSTYYCRCWTGYQLTANGYDCQRLKINIDLPILDGLCRQKNGYCQHLCVDISDQGHYCLCKDGFTLNPDHSTCKSSTIARSKPLLQGSCYSRQSSCSHYCRDIRNQHYCSCPSGYDLSSDNKTCDVNECDHSHLHNCSHICINTIGSYRCQCLRGYQLNPDGLTCRLIDQGNAVVVLCHADQMQIFIRRRFIPVEVNPYKLRLIDPKCQPMINHSHVVFKASLQQCGHKITELSDRIVYHNTVQQWTNQHDVIIRGQGFQIQLQCSYNKRARLANVAIEPGLTVNTIQIGQGRGNLTFKMDLFNTSDYIYPIHSSVPIAIGLQQMLYFELKVIPSQYNLLLFIEECFATPGPALDHPIRYHLIQNGCDIDSTIQRHETPSTSSVRFSIRPFQFIGNNPLVFFHCHIILCHRFSTESRCSRGCISNDTSISNRTKRDSDSSSKSFHVRQGPFILIGQRYSKALSNREARRQDVGNNTDTALKRFHNSRQSKKKPFSITDVDSDCYRYWILAIVSVCFAFACIVFCVVILVVKKWSSRYFIPSY